MSGAGGNGGGVGCLVYYCGPVSAAGTAPAGGYDAANRRTIDALRARGATVHELPYPRPAGTGALRKLPGYLVGFADLWRQVPAAPGAVFHLTGLYKQFVPAELMLLARARRRGLRTVYDIRAGRMERYYARFGPAYRHLFRRLLRCSDLVMIEGTDYAPFVESVTGRAPFYLPNHIPIDALPERAPRDPRAPPRMIFVGRVTPEKGVETALQAAALLNRDGWRCELAIVGPCEPILQARLQRDYPGMTWLGWLSSTEVLRELARADVFVFPTRAEGHSNALTEAMGMGCVPVASDAGFNGSVIGDCGVVLPSGAGAAEYAAAIRALWQAQRWQTLSQQAMKRTRELFSTEQAVARLLGAYHRLAKERA